MRERGVIGLLVCALVGCSSDHGAVLELQPRDTRTTHVQLFVAAELCADCTGMTPPAATKQLTGEVWYLDAAAMFIAGVTDGRARFLLVADDNDQIPLIEAIGFDGTGQITENATLHDLTVPRDEVQLWQQTMHPIAPVLPIPLTVDGGPAVGAMLWARPNDPAPGTADYMLSPRAGCLAVQDAEGKRRFLVPKDDADCDTYDDAMECDSTWYEYAEQPGPELCLTKTPACEIGLESKCVDGLAAPGCAPNYICIPDAYCTACGDPDLACLASVNNSAQTTRLACTISAELSATDSWIPCSTVSGAIDLSGLFENGVRCTNVSFRALTSLDSVTPATDAKTFANGEAQYTVRLAPPSSGYGCKFGVSWSGFVPPNYNGDSTHVSLLLSNGKRLALGLRLAFRSGCQTSNVDIACGVEPSMLGVTDNIWSCAR